MGCLGQSDAGRLRGVRHSGSPGETVQCRIAHKDRTLQTTGPQWYTTPGTWLDAFYLALVCRERDRITALCQVPLSLLRENGRADDHVFAWIDTLQTYWTGGPEISHKLVAAVDGTAPEVARDPETAGRLAYPPMEMFHRILRNDQAGFNQALATALQWHKDYWSSEESRAIDAMRPRRPRPARHGLHRPRRRHRDRGGIRVPAHRPGDAQLVRRVPHVRHT